VSHQHRWVGARPTGRQLLLLLPLRCLTSSLLQQPLLLAHPTCCNNVGTLPAASDKCWLLVVHPADAAAAVAAAAAAHFRGMKRELCVAPMPGRPCFTGL
jgi:hypothetical protein